MGAETGLTTAATGAVVVAKATGSDVGVVPSVAAATCSTFFGCCLPLDVVAVVVAAAAADVCCSCWLLTRFLALAADPKTRMKALPLLRSGTFVLESASSLGGL